MRPTPLTHLTPPPPQPRTHLTSGRCALRAGAYVALGALFANLMEGNFTHYADSDPSFTSEAPGMANLVGGAVFPIGLIAIFMTGANLYTVRPAPSHPAPARNGR